MSARIRVGSRFKPFLCFVLIDVRCLLLFSGVHVPQVENPITNACDGAAWHFLRQLFLTSRSLLWETAREAASFYSRLHLSLSLSTLSRKRDSGGFVRKLGGVICRRAREWTNEQASRISHEVLSRRPWRQSRQPPKLMITKKNHPVLFVFLYGCDKWEIFGYRLVDGANVVIKATRFLRIKMHPFEIAILLEIQWINARFAWWRMRKCIIPVSTNI
jgi:hypothetical protein